MNRDEIRNRYAAGEARADGLLDWLKGKPWTLAALGATHVAALLLGAWLF